MKTSEGNFIGVGPTRELSLRVSVAVLARVLFRHPGNDKWMLALEKKAILVNIGKEKVAEVKAQPFGGAIRISDLESLFKIIGQFHFDSSRSRDEVDFRVFIRPSSWPALREFCIRHLKERHDSVLENDPARELVEEFEDSLKIRLRPDQFTSEPAAILVEESPEPTTNIRASGYPTVRIYNVFETILTDPELVKVVVSQTNGASDKALSERVHKDARSGGKGRANAILALPLTRVAAHYTALPLADRNKSSVIDNHQIAETVPALLEEVSVPKYKHVYTF